VSHLGIKYEAVHRIYTDRIFNASQKYTMLVRCLPHTHSILTKQGLLAHIVENIRFDEKQ